MTIIVLDVSVVVAFLLPDASGPIAARALTHLETGAAAAPSLFWHEVRNSLLVAERRKRVAGADIAAFLERLRAFAVDDAGAGAGAGDDPEILRLARANGLTAYDAAYLDLALSRGLPLATLDTSLARGAKAEKVKLFG